MSWISQVLTALVDVWTLRTPAPLGMPTGAEAPIAVGVALIGGLSTVIGQGVIFAINRVSGVRMLVGITIGAVWMTLIRVVTAASIAVVAWAVTQGRVDGATIAVLYLLALAPHALGFLVFIPHLGLGIGQLLEGWTVLALVVMLARVLEIHAWWALLIGGGIWVATQVIAHLLSRPLARLTARVWTLTTGRPTYVTAHDVLAGAPFVPLEQREATT